MKVKLCSDLHLEFCSSGEGVPDMETGDILILGGDILCARNLKKNGPLSQTYKDFLTKCSDNFKHVLYVFGNHEAYGYHWDSSWEVVRENLPSNFKLLENDHFEIDDWVFLGCTLWTDFYKADPIAMMEAGLCMNDYKTITFGPKYRKLIPEDTLNFNRNSRQFLHDSVIKFKDKKIWIMTHHAPSHRSIASKYKNYGITNGAYVNDLDQWIIDNPHIKYCSHGHTHESFSYMIEQCRVLCNPRGYFQVDNVDYINPNFDTNLTVEL